MAHYLIDPEMKHELRYVVAKYLRLELAGVAPDSKAGHPKTALEPEAAVARYCEEADPPCACALRPSDVESREMGRLLADVEFPLIRVLAEMEFTGVRIDSNVLTDLSARLKERIRAPRKRPMKWPGVRSTSALPPGGYGAVRAAQHRPQGQENRPRVLLDNRAGA